MMTYSGICSTETYSCYSNESAKPAVEFCRANFPLRNPLCHIFLEYSGFEIRTSIFVHELLEHCILDYYIVIYE